jgi:hypothetical protein
VTAGHTLPNVLRPQRSASIGTVRKSHEQPDQGLGALGCSTVSIHFICNTSFASGTADNGTAKSLSRDQRSKDVNFGAFKDDETTTHPSKLILR